MLNRFADLQHEIWAHWMCHLFEVSIHNEDGTITIPADKVERWKRQMTTQYVDLSTDEQKSDLEQAQKLMTVINDNLTLEKLNIVVHN